MVDLSTKYLGLELKNPLIVGSSGLTGSVDSIVKLAASGAGAVVLKSVFEEEIQMEYQDTFKKELGFQENNLEFFDYYDYQIKSDVLRKTADLITQVKEQTQIPVIASINCRSVGEWFAYAKKLEQAGADALELNIFKIPVDASEDSEKIKAGYLNIVEKVIEHVSIPVSVKLSPYFTNLGNIAQRLEKSGARGLVFFNRFYNPDIDIENVRVTSGSVYSNPGDYVLPLRWISLLSKYLKCDMVASTGVHTPESFIKLLLAGASGVQVVSALYKNGPGYIRDILFGLEKWMEKKDLETVADIHNLGKKAMPANRELFERVQFMRYFGEHQA